MKDEFAFQDLGADRTVEFFRQGTDDGQAESGVFVVRFSPIGRCVRKVFPGLRSGPAPPLRKVTKRRPLRFQGDVKGFAAVGQGVFHQVGEDAIEGAPIGKNGRQGFVDVDGDGGEPLVQFFVVDGENFLQLILYSNLFVVKDVIPGFDDGELVEAVDQFA